MNKFLQFSDRIPFYSDPFQNGQIFFRIGSKIILGPSESEMIWVKF
jgi:hypothetical protein